MTAHTCSSSSRVNCKLCAQLETELWDAINRYARAVGGDLSSYQGNAPCMQAVADVGKFVAKAVSRQRIDDVVIEDLVKSGNGAAAAACKFRAASMKLEQENARLRADLDLSGPDSACCRARHRAEEERDKLSADVAQLRASLTDVRGFLRGTARRPELGRGAKDLLDEADAIDRALDGKAMW